ncbi:hypothetical protein, partial [Providencia stuartii]|uniref:hypothetical protein n=2 Tax=Enterobacterales TaxID=91347 RepID=UPI0013D25E53
MLAIAAWVYGSFLFPDDLQLNGRENAISSHEGIGIAEIVLLSMVLLAGAILIQRIKLKIAAALLALLLL